MSGTLIPFVSIEVSMVCNTAIACERSSLCFLSVSHEMQIKKTAVNCMFCFICNATIIFLYAILFQFTAQC